MVIAAAALGAPAEERVKEVLEVDCPDGVCPGDTIEVLLPEKLGCGKICVIVPKCCKPGETIEVPL